MSGPRLLRTINSVRLLQALRRSSGPRSRADLAREIGLNRSSVTHVVNELMGEGWVRESGPISGGAGRPGIGLELDPDGVVFLGVVLMQRGVDAVALDLLGQVRARRERDLSRAPRRDPEGTFDVIAEVLDDVLSSSGISADRLGGVGVAVPGVVSGSMVHWAFDPVPTPTDVRALLDPHVEAPVFVENDANASALAELHFASQGKGGAAGTDGVADAPLGAPAEAPVRHLFYLYLEEGVGGGLVIDGRIYRGASGAAGEIGRMPIGPPPPPEAGRDAWFGTQVDGRGLLARYREAGGSADTAADVVAAFRAGEIAAATAVERWGGWLARGCATIAQVVDPEWIVIGGPLSELLPSVLPAIRNALTEVSGAAGVAGARVRASGFGTSAGVFGAAALPYHAFFTLPDVRQ